MSIYATCPTCKAGFKEECRSKTGGRTSMHAARLALDDVSQPGRFCRVCGKEITVQVFKGTGICGTNCQKKADSA